MMKLSEVENGSVCFIEDRYSKRVEDPFNNNPGVSIDKEINWAIGIKYIWNGVYYYLGVSCKEPNFSFSPFSYIQLSGVELDRVCIDPAVDIVSRDIEPDHKCLENLYDTIYRMFRLGGFVIDETGELQERVFWTDDVRFVPLEKVIGIRIKEISRLIQKPHFAVKADIYRRFDRVAKDGKMYNCLGGDYNYVLPYDEAGLELLEEVSRIHMECNPPDIYLGTNLNVSKRVIV